MSFEDRIQKFYDRVLETWNSVNTFIEHCEQFQDVWGFNYPLVKSCRLFCDDAKREIDMMESRLMSKTLKCVIIGKVSSGKSTLINSLLLRKVLPSGFCCRTNSFIEVKKSLDGRNYILIGDEEKGLELLKHIADDFSPDALSPGSLIELFLSPVDNSLLNDDVIIVDTPGFDDLSGLDNSIEETSMDADVLILVVSSVIGLGEKERQFISQHKTKFSKLNVILLYSFWDMPQEENIERSNVMRQRLLSQAQQFLEKDLSILAENSQERVFFVSAEERLASLSNVHDDTNQLARYRNEEFQKFLVYLKSNLWKNSYTRRLSIVDHICETFDSIFTEIEFSVEEMKIKESDFGNKLREDLIVLGDFDIKIKTEVEMVFKESYNQFFDKGLELIKTNIALNSEDIKEKLNYILQELIVVMEESIKIRIRDLVDTISAVDGEHCINILESLYFPNYFNLWNHLESFTIETLQKSFIEINRVKKIGTGLSIGGAVIGAALTLASGGILAGVVLPIPTIFGASVLGAAGAAVGGGTAGGISNLLISINREAFGHFYKKEEKLIKELWKNMEEDIANSFLLFLTEISNRVDILIVPLKDEFYTLPNKINFLKSEAHRIRSSL